MVFSDLFEFVQFGAQMGVVADGHEVEKFQQAQQKAATIKAHKQEVVKAREERRRPTSLKEMLDLAKKQATS